MPVYEAEDNMRRLVDFILYMSAIEPAPQDANESGKGSSYVPLLITQVELSLEQIVIMHRIVQVARRLELVLKGFFVCDRVCVDPRQVQSSSEYLTTFLNVFALRSERGLVIETGPYEADAIDERDQDDRSDVCDAILQGIANCNKVRKVKLGGMVELCKSARTRRGIYRALIRHVLSRATPCDVWFDAVLVSPLDAQALEDEYDGWKTVHPKGRLCVKQLVLEVIESGNTFASAIIDILANIVELVLENHDEDGRFQPETLIPRIIAKFPDLRKLAIAKVNVPSMDIFIQANAHALEELRLNDVRLRDQASFVRFVRVLGDPTSRLARKLQMKEESSAMSQLDVSILRVIFFWLPLPFNVAS